MKIIDNEILSALSRQASQSERLRKNYNLHLSLNDNVQRLLNALEPGTDVPVHRHTETDETYILLNGALNVLIFNDEMELTKKVQLDPAIGKYGISIPAGTWHSIEVLKKGTVIFEVKEGPYTPLESKDILKVHQLI